jgi:hypothetical protein
VAKGIQELLCTMYIDMQHRCNKKMVLNTGAVPLDETAGAAGMTFGYRYTGWISDTGIE